MWLRMIERLTAYSFDDDAGDLVRVGVAGGSAVFKVTLAVLGDLARDTDAATAVGNAPAELVDVAGLVATGQTILVAFTVDGDVLKVTGLELLHGSLNDLEATFGSCRGGGDVAVKTGSVPVAGDWLGG